MKKVLLILLLSSYIFGDKIVVGVENINYFPHYSVDNGEYLGVGRDVIDAFAKDSNYEVVYKPLPVKRLFNALVQGQIDLKYPDNKNWATDIKKDAKVFYSKKIISYIDGVMVKPLEVGKGKQRIKTLGTVMGFTPFEYIDDIKSQKIKVRENPSFTALLRQTIVGRVDGAYINIDVANYNLNEVLKEGGSLKFDKNLPYTKDYYHLSSVKNPKLVKEFDSWLEKNQDKLSLIKAKYNLK